MPRIEELVGERAVKRVMDGEERAVNERRFVRRVFGVFGVLGVVGVVVVVVVVIEFVELVVVVLVLLAELVRTRAWRKEMWS